MLGEEAAAEFDDVHGECDAHSSWVRMACTTTYRVRVCFPAFATPPSTCSGAFYMIGWLAG